MSLDLSSLPPRKEYTDAECSAMSPGALLHASAIFRHEIQADDSWVVTAENAPAREILWRLNAYDLDGDE